MTDDPLVFFDPADKDFKTAEEDCLKLNLPDKSLFSTCLSNEEIMDLVGHLAPSLSRRDHRMIAFIKMARAAVDRADPPTFPSIESMPEWWASTNEQMDGLWD